MKFDLQLLLILLFTGLIYKKLSWKGWFGVSLLVFTWMMYNWIKQR